MTYGGLMGSYTPTPLANMNKTSSLFGSFNNAATNATTKATTQGLTKGQATLGGITAGLQALELGLGIWNQIESSRIANKQLALSQEQLKKENERWEARENERKENNKAIAQSANAFILPTERD